MTERRPVRVRRTGSFVQLTADAEATAHQVATAVRMHVPPDARLDGPLRARFTVEGAGRGEEPAGPVTP